MVISKGRYRYGEHKNLLPYSVQKPYLPLWGRKLPRFIGGSIGPRMQICETSGLLIPMVPRFHRANVYIKWKLRVWRSQKGIALVGEETILTSAGPQTTPFDEGQYRAGNGNVRNFGPTNPYGNAFAPKQWLYQKKNTGMVSSKIYCPSRCRNRTYQCGAANYPVSWKAVQGREWKDAKLRAYQSPWYRVSTN